jgi:hypothetical protein
VGGKVVFMIDVSLSDEILDFITAEQLLELLK